MNECKSYQGRTAEYARPNKRMNEFEKYVKRFASQTTRSHIPIRVGQWTSASTYDGIQKLHGYGVQNYFVYSMLGTVINLYIVYLTYENYSDSLLYVCIR